MPVAAAIAVLHFDWAEQADGKGESGKEASPRPRNTGGGAGSAGSSGVSGSVRHRSRWGGAGRRTTSALPPGPRPTAGPRRPVLAGGAAARSGLCIVLRVWGFFLFGWGFFRCFRPAFALLPARRYAKVGVEVQKKKKTKRNLSKCIPSGPGASGGSVGSGACPVLLPALPGRPGPPRSRARGETPCPRSEGAWLTSGKHRGKGMRRFL